MARQRFIWPTLWTDPTVGSLSPPARLLFIGCFSMADDEGRLEGDPAYLRATIFPHDQFDAAAVQSFRDEMIARCRNLVLYEFDGRDYISFGKWRDFQKPKYPKPSKIPPPPKRIPRKPASLSEKPSGTLPGSLPEASGNDSEAFPHRVGLGRDGLGRENLPPSSEANYARPTLVGDDTNWNTDLQPLTAQPEEGRKSA